MSVTTNLRWVLGVLLAVVSHGANAQAWNVSVSPDAACPTAAQLNERLQTCMKMASQGHWGLVVTRIEAEALNVELTLDGRLIGRRKLTTAGAACPDVAQTVALLVSSWVSNTAQAPPTVSPAKPPARQRTKRNASKPEGTPVPTASEEALDPLDVSAPPEVAPLVVEKETPIAPEIGRAHV